MIKDNEQLDRVEKNECSNEMKEKEKDKERLNTIKRVLSILLLDYMYRVQDRMKECEDELKRQVIQRNLETVEELLNKLSEF